MASHKWYTLTEIESITNLAHTTLLMYVKHGYLKAVKFGGRGKWRVSEENLNRFLTGQPQLDYAETEDGNEDE